MSEERESNYFDLDEYNYSRFSIDAGEPLSNNDTDSNNSNTGTYSKISTIFMLLNTMLGSGMLIQPEVMKTSGLGGGIFIFVFAAIFTWLGLCALIDCGVANGKLGYTELAHHAFGKRGEVYANIMIILNTFGGLISYLLVVGGTSSELLQTWASCHDNIFCSVYFITLMLVVVFLLPFCLLRYYGKVAHLLSYLSCVSLGGVVMLVVIGGPVEGDRRGSLKVVDVPGKQNGTGCVMWKYINISILVLCVSHCNLLTD